VLNSSLFKFQSGRFLTTTINQLTTETLNSFEIPLPPPMEQIKIAEWLDKSLEKLDAVISRTECSINLLKERRSAFITAAVTGQIDLREAV
jgi:type I restriction enzyme S subunit